MLFIWLLTPKTSALKGYVSPNRWVNSKANKPKAELILSVIMLQNIFIPVPSTCVISHFFKLKINKEL